MQATKGINQTREIQEMSKAQTTDSVRNKEPEARNARQDAG